MENKYSRRRVKGFLHADGCVMRNGDGEEILLCGWGAGSWNNPEGFMCGDRMRSWNEDPHAIPARFERARTIEDSIRLLCGTEYAKKFWPQWYRNHLSKDDIKAMAELGYNSIRLPLNARAFLAEEPGYHWNQDSFEMLDDVINWCEEYGLYAILDMHAVPGGQTGLKCDDGLESTPRFYLEQESKERCIRLWEKFAERYKSRWIVGGYDLLNEPLARPDSLALIPELIGFYEELISRIRKIDKIHMLSIEGASASTNNEIFDRNYDPECNNWCIHIHYYGFSPHIRSFYRYLEPAMRLNVPVWLGEGGGEKVEAGALLQVAESLNMGYNLWGWKIAVNPAKGIIFRSPVKYILPKQWDRIIDSLNEGKPRPGYTECQKIFDEMLENIRYENCKTDKEQHIYFLKKPGRMIPAVAYDADICPGELFLGSWNYGNPYDFRTEDRMHLVIKDGCIPPRDGNAFAQSSGSAFRTNQPLSNLNLQLDDGDYASYSVYQIEKAGCEVKVTARALTKGAKLIVSSEKQRYEVWVSESDTFVLYDLLELEECECCRVKICSSGGSIQLENVIFSAKG